MSTDVLAERLGQLLDAAHGFELGRNGLWRGAWALATVITAAPVDAITSHPGDEGSPEEAAGQLRAILTRLGVAPDTVESLTKVSMACAAVENPANFTDPDLAGAEAGQVVERGQDLLAAIESLTAAGGLLDSVVLCAVRQLTAVHAKVLLNDKGATHPAELTVSQQEKWRSRAKSMTRHEIVAAIGWGVGEVGDLVAVAHTPAAVTASITHSLRCGESSWRLVRSYYRACTGMDQQDGAKIANAFFGTDPDAAVTERVDSAGAFLGGPWRHHEFYRALKREVARVNAQDRQKQHDADAAAKANADTHLMLDENGTGTFLIGCTPLVGTAIAERIEAAARKARAGGDPRNLRELRCAVATALLLHGVVDLSHIPDDPDHVTIDQSQQLTRLMAGLPPATLDVIVPLTTLLGANADGTPAVPGTNANADADGALVPAAAFTAQSGNTSGPGGLGCTCTCTCAASTRTCPDSPGTGLRGQPCPERDDPHDDTDDLVNQDMRLPDVGVAEVVGGESLFLTPSQVRELALVPGSSMYRLLTDPVTGRCLERSTTAYRFDAAMRAQIIAADRFCRAPGCLKPAKTSQLDHVQEYGTTGGHTCEANGMAASTACHDRKTKKDVDAIINTHRDVTWTTLLGRIYTTKAHDYTQYTKLLTAATDQIEQEITAGTPKADAVDAAIYQALSYRPPGAPFQAREDHPGFENDFTSWDQITLTHTSPDGQRTYRPAPNATRAEHQRHQATHTDHDPASHAQEQPRNSERHDGHPRNGQSHDGHPRNGYDTRDSSDKNSDRHTGHGPWSDPHDDPPPF